MKTCCRCQTLKPIDQFRPNGRGGIKGTCIDCVREQTRRSQQKHYRNNGKEYIYRWYEAQGGQYTYKLRLAYRKALKQQ